MVNFLFFSSPWAWGFAEKSERPDFHDPVVLKGIIAKAVQLEAVKKADGSMQYLEPLELSSYQGSGWGVVYHENRKLRFLAQFKNGKVNGFSFSCYPSGQAMAEACVIEESPKGFRSLGSETAGKVRRQTSRTEGWKGFLLFGTQAVAPKPN